jgi:hypothetical protein
VSGVGWTCVLTRVGYREAFVVWDRRARSARTEKYPSLRWVNPFV